MQQGVMSMLTAGAIGLLVLIAVMMIVPVIAGEFEDNMPALGAASDWNSTHNTELPNLADTYTSASGFITLGVIVVFAVIIIVVIKGALA